MSEERIEPEPATAAEAVEEHAAHTAEQADETVTREEAATEATAHEAMGASDTELTALRNELGELRRTQELRIGTVQREIAALESRIQELSSSRQPVVAEATELPEVVVQSSESVAGDAQREVETNPRKTRSLKQRLRRR